MIVKEYDLWMAVSKYCQACDIEISYKNDNLSIFALPRKKDEAIVYTTKGDFWCRTFEGEDGTIYTDVEILPK